MTRLTANPLFGRLRAEAESFHLTQSGVVARPGTRVQGGRDVDTLEVIYTGPIGAVRQKAQGAQRVLVELPASAPVVHDGDIVTVDTGGFPVLVVEGRAPDTENRALTKLNCVTRVKSPDTGEK